MDVMHNVIQAIKEIIAKRDTHIKAIETGTIRSYHEKHESTKHIAKTLGNRGSLISIDKSQQSIKISKDICGKKNLTNIEWILSDGAEYLKEVKGEFDFVLLDSVNDAEIIWKEFKAIAPKIKEGGILIVDDAGIKKNGGLDTSIPAKKGQKVWTELKDHIKIKILNSPHGTQLRIDFTPDTIKTMKGNI